MATVVVFLIFQSMNDEEGNALLGNGKNNVYGADNLGGDVILRVFSTGVRFSTGLASSYELKYVK